MANFLFIESQDPLEDRGAEEYLGQALELLRQKQTVTVLFVENGAHAVRKGAQVPIRDALREAGATLQVDELALRERGIKPERLSPGIAVTTADAIVDLLANGAVKAIWH